MNVLSALGIKVSAPKVAEPWLTLEKRLVCPHCQGSAYVVYPWDADEFQRAQKTREAVEEHRKICPKADATEARVYEISYPRV
jgi:hypothetical protein